MLERISGEITALRAVSQQPSLPRRSSQLRVCAPRVALTTHADALSSSAGKVLRRGSVVHVLEARRLKGGAMRVRARGAQRILAWPFISASQPRWGRGEGTRYRSTATPYASPCQASCHGKPEQ